MVFAKAKRKHDGEWTLLIGLSLEHLRNYLQDFVNIANEPDAPPTSNRDVLDIESLQQIMHVDELQNIDATVIYHAGMIAITESLTSESFGETAVGFRPPTKYIK